MQGICKPPGIISIAASNAPSRCIPAPSAIFPPLQSSPIVSIPGVFVADEMQAGPRPNPELQDLLAQLGRFLSANESRISAEQVSSCFQHLSAKETSALHRLFFWLYQNKVGLSRWCPTHGIPTCKLLVIIEANRSHQENRHSSPNKRQGAAEIHHHAFFWTQTPPMARERGGFKLPQPSPLAKTLALLCPFGSRGWKHLLW